MGSLVPREPRDRVLLAGLLALVCGLAVLLAGSPPGAFAGSPAGDAAWIASGAPASGAPASGAPASGAPSGGAVENRDFCTVILVRHAEKDPGGDAKDPGLSEPGRKRAAALARLLGPAGVSRLFASEYRRAQETLAPLAERSGHTVEIMPAGDSGRLIAALSSLPAGAVCVVAGHSNTIPALVEKLGGRISNVVSTPKGPELRESEFDRMFVVTLGPPDKAASPVARTALSTLELSYGDG
jgi:phosphohistidine phosphatase SixA